MGQFAARKGDMVKQDAPHCHANIHPVATATPAPHPALPLQIVSGQIDVTIGGSPAARVTDKTAPCSLASCTPAGPGEISKGSATVTIGGQPAARVNDMSAHKACSGPIPSPVGKVMSPCCPTVTIGG